MAVCPSARNVSALKNLPAASSFFASTQPITTPYWPHRPTTKSNQCFFSPIDPPENCPALLTTKKSCFENYATQNKNLFDSWAKLRQRGKEQSASFPLP